MQYHIQTLRVRADFSAMQVPETCSCVCGKLAYLPLWPHQTKRGRDGWHVGGESRLLHIWSAGTRPRAEVGDQSVAD